MNWVDRGQEENVKRVSFKPLKNFLLEPDTLDSAEWRGVQAVRKTGEINVRMF